MFMMSHNDSNHQKKSTFPPYVTLPFMTKQRCSSAAATSRLHQKFGVIDTSVATGATQSRIGRTPYPPIWGARCYRGPKF